MADTYKTLTSVDTVTSVSDTDYVIVNDSDAVKQITKANLLSELTSTVSENSSDIVSNTSDISDLDTRVTTLEGGTITTDTTLSVSGMPADAEVVGDDLSDLESDNVTISGKYDLTFTDGGRISNTTGALSTNSSYKYTDLIEIGDTDLIKVVSDVTPASYAFYNGWYDSDQTFLFNFSVYTGNMDALRVPDGASYMRLSIPTGTTVSLYAFAYTFEDAINDNINGLSDYINPMLGKANYDSSGALINGNRPCTQLMPLPFSITNVSSTSYKYYVSYFDSDGAWSVDVSWATLASGVSFTFDETYAYARVFFDNTSVSNNSSSPSNGTIYDAIKFKQIDSVKDTLVNDVSYLNDYVSSIITLSDVELSSDWEVGTINGSTGAESASTTRARSGYIDVSNFESLTFTVTDGYKYGGHFYDSDKNWVGYIDTSLTEDDTDYTLADDEVYVRLLVADTSDGTASTDYSQYLTVTGNSNFSNMVADITNSLPDYVESNIETVTTELNTVQTANTSSIMFMTDLHLKAYDTNTTATFLPIARAEKAIERINKTNMIDYCVLGGDYLWNSTATTNALATTAYEFLQETFYPLRDKLFALKGNHDDNSIALSVQGLTGVIYPDTQYRYLGKQYERSGVVMEKDEHDKFYGYYDIPSQKIRCIFINTVDIPYEDDTENDTLVYNGQHQVAISQSQSEFVQNALVFSESGWSVIFFSHHGLVYSSVNSGSEDYCSELWGIIKAFKNQTSYSGTVSNYWGDYSINVDYSSNASNGVVASVVGHNHADRSETIDDILIISTGTACCSQSSEVDGTSTSHTYGTATETIFDIFTIDTENQKLYATRYGLGDSREWSY